jgi:hypothetical protein
MSKDRNETARLRAMGLFNSGTFPTVEAATRAFVAWAASANASGKDLAGMAVLVDDKGATVTATLAWRRYWRNLAIRTGNPALYRAFSEPDAPNALRVFVAGADGDSSFVLSLDDLKECA